MKFWSRVICLLVVATLAVGCGVTRRIPQGKYLLQKNEIEVDKSVPRDERITAPEINRYVRQQPNKRFLGTNFYLWTYLSANPDKQNWWNNLKRRIGEAPVYLDSLQTERSASNIKIYMDSRGYFNSQASYHIDTTSRHRAIVTYRTEQGQPYRIGQIKYRFRDRFLEPIILADTASSLLHEGNVLDFTVLDKERSRISTMLRDNGYFNFTINNILYEVDTTVGGYRADVTVEVRQVLTGYNDRGKPIMDNNTVYRLRNVNLFSNYDPTVARSDSSFMQRLDTIEYRGLNIIYEDKLKVRPKVLRQTIDLFPNHLFSAKGVQDTYDQIMRVGYYRSANIQFEEDTTTTEVSFIGAGATGVDHSLSTKEGYLNCNIFCTPALPQSYKVELEGSTTSSFYGLRGTVGYQNHNIFRGMELLDVSFSLGYEFMKGAEAKRKRAFEIGGSASLSFPRFIVPFDIRRSASISNPRTKVELSINSQDRPYYQRVLSSASWSYTWGNGRYSNYALRPIDLTLIKVGYIDPEFLDRLQNPYLRNSYSQQLIAGISGSYVFNNQIRNINGNATNLRFNWETAGNLVGALSHLLSKPVPERDHYNVFGIRYSQYFRTDLSFSRKEVLGAKTALAYRLYAGAGLAYGNSTEIPIDRLFYAGGSNSMRGWAARTLGPGSVTITEDQRIYPSQVGNMKIEANLEFRFPIWSMFNGALFFDAGNVFMIGQKDREYAEGSVFHFNDFYKNIGFNTGLGIRLDISFAVLRFDWGIRFYDPNQPLGERWIHNFRWGNTALNFGVGYPF